MSDTNPTESNPDESEKVEIDDSHTNTDWLAHCVDGYGYGYTKEQAILAVAPHFNIPTNANKKIFLAEHVGNATTGMMGYEVDHLVYEEVIELEPDMVEELQEKAMRAKLAGEKAADTAEVLDYYDPKAAEE